MDEKRLVKQIAAGDRRAFEEFLDSYGGRVHRLVRRYVENPSDAEDVTQDVFCDIYRSIPRFRGDSQLSTWVYRVALNHCFKYRQKQKPDCLPVDDYSTAATDWHVDPTQSALKSDLATHVHGAIRDLSPVHYDVVVMCELQGFTYQECADALEIPVGTVKSRLYNAIRRLRESLSGYMADELDTRLASAGEVRP